MDQAPQDQSPSQLESKGIQAEGTLRTQPNAKNSNETINDNNNSNSSKIMLIIIMIKKKEEREREEGRQENKGKKTS